MRVFVRDFALFALLQAAFIGALLWMFYDVRDISPLSPATVIKHTRLADAPSPRMVLIGGSNLLFGIDSTMIESHTPFQPVNMGLIGGLRLEYIINEVESSLRSGDMVVMSLEYNTLNADESVDETQIIMGVAAQRWANMRFITWPQWKQVLDRGAMEYAGVVFRQCVSGIGKRFEADDLPINDDMNAYGDLTRYHDPNVQPRNENNQNTIVKFKPESVALNVAKINDFAARCKERDVQVALVYPPIPRTHFDRNAAVARRFHRQLRETLKPPLLNSPEDVVFDDRHFIGLSYHLRGEAVQRRTQLLIDAVNRRLSRVEQRQNAADSTTQPND